MTKGRWITTQWCRNCGSNVGQDEAALGGIVCPRCGNHKNYVRVPTHIRKQGIFKSDEISYKLDGSILTEQELKSALIQA